MTREEVIKALSVCSADVDCSDCPYYDANEINFGCHNKLMEAALKLIEQDRIYNRDDLMESFYGFIHTEVEWFLGQDATYADSSMHHIAGAVSLLQTILKSGESLVRKEKTDA